MHKRFRENNIDGGELADKKGQYAQAEICFTAALKEAEKFGPQDVRLARTVSAYKRL